MAAIDMQAEVLGWALTEIGTQCLGEDYGAAVSWAPVIAQTPDGPRQIPVWLILLTARNPLLSEGPLYHMVQLGPVRPTIEQVRKEVGDGIRQLRDLARAKLGGLNGHAKAGVPG